MILKKLNDSNADYQGPDGTVAIPGAATGLRATDRHAGLACGPIELSDLVPDEWFDGCKWAFDMLCYPKFTGIFPRDFEVEACE